jgi:hypothetical protein
MADDAALAADVRAMLRTCDARLLRSLLADAAAGRRFDLVDGA